MGVLGQLLVIPVMMVVHLFSTALSPWRLIAKVVSPLIWVSVFAVWHFATRGSAFAWVIVVLLVFEDMTGEMIHAEARAGDMSPSRATSANMAVTLVLWVIGIVALARQFVFGA